MDFVPHIRLVDEPIEHRPPPFSGECGSVVEFWGVVRGEERGTSIDHLQYEAYRPMAEHQFKRLAAEVAREYPIAQLEVVHRLGRVPVGEASLLVRVWSKHRREGFGFLARFCDRFKEDVPIWKNV